MAQDTTLEHAHALLERLDYGEHGLTRHDMRRQLPELPDIIYLHLPDSKRFSGSDEVMHEVRTSPGRAEGEFIAATDDTESAESDYGPAGYGDSLVIRYGYCRRCREYTRPRLRRQQHRHGERVSQVTSASTH